MSKTPGVIRRRRAKLVVEAKTADEAYELALKDLAESLAHGDVAAIHGEYCKGGSPCDCQPQLVGPAVRGVWQ